MKVDMNALMGALDSVTMDESYHLDKQTGEVILIVGEIGSNLDDFLDEEDDLTGPEEASASFEERLAESDLADWEKDDLRLRYRIEYDDTGRFVTVPSADSDEGYQDMEAFIETVGDEQLRNRLCRAIGGRGAFRMFKDTLTDYPEERERWFKFKDDRLRKRALDWLESLDIEPETD